MFQINTFRHNHLLDRIISMWTPLAHDQRNPSGGSLTAWISDCDRLSDILSEIVLAKKTHPEGKNFER